DRKPPPTSGNALDHVVIVLHETQDLVNIAGTIRAMTNMGIFRLRLVRPREFSEYRIQGIAHQAGPVLESLEIHDSLDDALADAVWVIGTSARRRSANRNYGRPRELTEEMIERSAEGTVAIVFGREDRGLDNEALDRCDRIAIIPTDLRFTSLNLAQAVLVLCWELSMHVGDTDRELPEGRRATRAATRDELEHMYGALEQGLHRIDFFKARKPDAVLRTIRTILSRADLDRRESRLLAAVGFEIGNWIDRNIEEPANGADIADTSDAGGSLHADDA
ncbi:MAG TPA: TrmJ/YjtD family RNA methyltransferase, partial [Myxococcota bacterium]|nr:TrmJ/YjtD family RNA methyltransferase [Myxococcota bacterium]